MKEYSIPLANEEVTIYYSHFNYSKWYFKITSGNCKIRLRNVHPCVWIELFSIYFKPVLVLSSVPDMEKLWECDWIFWQRLRNSFEVPHSTWFVLDTPPLIHPLPRFPHHLSLSYSYQRCRYNFGNSVRQ